MLQSAHKTTFMNNTPKHKKMRFSKQKFYIILDVDEMQDDQFICYMNNF